MTASRINVSRKMNGVWVLRVDGKEVAQFIGGNDTQVEILILSAQHIAGVIGSKGLEFTMSPDNMEIIKRVGNKKPKLIKLN